MIRTVCLEFPGKSPYHIKHRNGSSFCLMFRSISMHGAKKGPRFKIQPVSQGTGQFSALNLFEKRVRDRCSCSL